jgi:peroxiredoxin
MAGQMKAVDEQIAQLKSEQREYVDELKAIRDLALKEKAKDTAKRLEALIAKRQRTFQQRLRALEQRRSRLERIRGQRPGVQRDAVRGPGARKAPDFTLSSFDGKKVSLADYKGKIVVLEWLNFECPYSRYHYESAKTMIDLANKYKSRDVVWLAVNSTNHTTPGANKDFAGKYKLPYPILDDRPGKVGRSYKAQTTPHMFVIDRDGWIVYEGAIDNSAMGKAPEGKEPLNHVEEALQELIAGRQITTPKTKPYGCSVKYAG